MDVLFSELSKGDIKDLSFIVNGKTISLSPEQITSLKNQMNTMIEYSKNMPNIVNSKNMPNIVNSMNDTLTNIAKRFNMKGGSMDNSIYEQMNGFINSEYSELEMNNDTLSLTEFKR